MRVFFTILSLIFVTTIHAQTPGLSWAKSFGSDKTEEGKSIAIDAAGNIYVVGSFDGNTDFDPGVDSFKIASVDLNDIFITKLDPAGNFIWAKSIGGPGNDVANNICIDPSGNLLITGQYFYTVDFAPGPDTAFLNGESNGDIFILKMDSAGTTIWAKGISGNNVDIGQAITSDDAGNVYTTGQFTRTVDFDPGPGTNNLTSASGTSPDVFVLKLNSSGDFVFAKSVGGTSADVGRDIEVDATGAVYIAGSYSSEVDFNPDQGNFTLIAGSNGTNAFLLKLTPAGYFSYAKDLTAASGGSSESCTSMELDNQGNIYLTGTFNGTCDFDPATSTYYLSGLEDNFSDIFVSKLTGSGNFIWARSMGGLRADRALSLAVNAAGSVFISGSFAQTCDFDPDVNSFDITSGGENDAYLAKLDAAGNFLFAGSISGPKLQNGNAIAFDNDGSIVMTGNFRETTDFDPESGVYTITPIGLNDAFVMRLTDPGALSVGATASGQQSSTLYPNPAQDYVTLSSETGFSNATIRLFNINGQLMQEWKQVKGNSLNVQLGTFIPGMYILEATHNNGAKEHFRLVKQ